MAAANYTNGNKKLRPLFAGKAKLPKQLQDG
jgi:hypothetical protein